MLFACGGNHEPIILSLLSKIGLRNTLSKGEAFKKRAGHLKRDESGIAGSQRTIVYLSAEQLSKGSSKQKGMDVLPPLGVLWGTRGTKGTKSKEKSKVQASGADLAGLRRKESHGGSCGVGGRDMRRVPSYSMADGAAQPGALFHTHYRSR